MVTTPSKQNSGSQKRKLQSHAPSSIVHKPSLFEMSPRAMMSNIEPPKPVHHTTHLLGSGEEGAGPSPFALDHAARPFCSVALADTVAEPAADSSRPEPARLAESSGQRIPAPRSCKIPRRREEAVGLGGVPRGTSAAPPGRVRTSASLTRSVEHTKFVVGLCMDS